MIVRVIKREGDTSKPDNIETDTAFAIGDRFEMEYDWCTKMQCMNGYRPIWHKAVAEFVVEDIVCNMLINPSSIWVRLKSDDKVFQKRCGSGSFDVPEKQVLKRTSATKNIKTKERKKVIWN
ncbi:MAG: hypothetical protein K5768_06910 [Firmicutes bacterium]|nr:hypothetical protein [Bacillota bacterium]